MESSTSSTIDHTTEKQEEATAIQVALLALRGDRHRHLHRKSQVPELTSLPREPQGKHKKNAFHVLTRQLTARCSRHSRSISSCSGHRHHGHHDPDHHGHAHHGHAYHGHRGHRVHRAHPHDHHPHHDRFDQSDHHNQFDNDDQFDFFEHNDDRDHWEQQDQHDYHERLYDADFGLSEELKYVNVAYNRNDADLSEWELFEIAKDAIQSGSATVTENPIMNVQRLVWSIKVEGRFPTEAHVLNEAYAIFSRMQLDTEFERGNAWFPRPWVFRSPNTNV
ncbi:hypothetical protein N7474_009747 [Penicillium riverlandense]|uniref:uncharacterized protein n=1 Tax=Penicillium riverlandense TaxID=1903569 RepID=UPI0025486E8E|nr:uncharacterized protein N7474_009747 [Penicillium riverlandense]KAJ5808478.1 hypothetical protein N7474_009747 [Penicillium riverlandense]